MVAQATVMQDRRANGKRGYTVFLLLHVFVTVGFLAEYASAASEGLWLRVVAVLLTVCLLAAYTFAARWISFRATLGLTLVWLAMASNWFFGWFTIDLGTMAVVYFLLYVTYVCLFSAGLLLKRPAERVVAS